MSEQPVESTEQTPEQKLKASRTSKAGTFFVVFGLLSFIGGTIGFIISLDNVTTVFQEGVIATYAVDTTLGMLLVALGTIVKRLDILIMRD